MSHSAVQIISPERNTAYTTSRSDIVQLVPLNAIFVLDIGCSNGALGQTLKNDMPQRIVYGVELDTNFSNEAAKKLDCVFNGDINGLNWDKLFDGQRFDCIIFADVLEHLVDPKKSLELAIKYLNENGTVIVSLPNVRHLSALWAIFFNGRFPKRDRGIFDRTHLHWFTVRDSYSLLTDCGLDISATRLALRWGDTGGGVANRYLNRLPICIKNWAPVREFLTYQICIRAEKSN